MLNHGAELENYKTKCHGLSIGKLKNLVLTKVALERELQDYKTTCSRMKDEITGLTNAGKIVSERKKTAHDRIMESDEKCMLVQLKNENMVLECGLRRAEDETENWKKRFMELEMGLGSSQKEVAYDDICEKYMDEYISRKMEGKVIVASVAHSAESEKVPSPAFLSSANFSSLQGNFEDVHVSGNLFSIMARSHLIYQTFFIYFQTHLRSRTNATTLQKNICSDTKVELVSEAKQQLGSETGGSCKENLVLLKQDSVTTSSTCIIEINSEDEVIEISDSEDEKEVPSKHTCKNKDEDVEHASTEGTWKTLNKYLKRPLSVWGSRDLDIPFSSTMKRCKISDTSGSVSQEDDKCQNIEI
ncbi:hypothetical protein MKW92_010214 [Papaver armeniacum]|nr:hypothetical protein MKW92_010214 [Papaver armeniacum]